MREVIAEKRTMRYGFRQISWGAAIIFSTLSGHYDSWWFAIPALIFILIAIEMETNQ